MKTPEEIATDIVNDQCNYQWAGKEYLIEMITRAIQAERQRIAELEKALAVLGEEWQVRFLKERERVEELEKALEPFGAVADWFEVTGVSDETFVEAYSSIRKNKVLLTLDHCRSAAELLKK